ncbi:MAG: glycoside hydrolase family 127 protein [Bacteroidales bacterium]|nr:glycoside hydrolase family 127 protein [Bacteroidales bacterium]
MKKSVIVVLFTLLAISSSQAQEKLYKDEFPISDVTLLDGPLKRARDLNVAVLLQYDTDRLLAPFLKEAGLEPKAELYPNWAGLDGHVGGHYLSALAMNAATGSKECEERMMYMISELKRCAEANAVNHPGWGRGYIGGVPESDRIWSEFKKGNIRPYAAAWVPFYNVHKVFAGLRDAWLYCGNEDAKELFLGCCDWALDITSGLDDATMERALDTEQGGMNEVIADAYAITGDTKYLEGAKRFSHKWLLNAMASHTDVLDNVHANTQVPKVVGFQRIAELSGDEDYAFASRFFWDIVTRDRTVAFGGNSRREHFPSKESSIDLINDVDGPESCNTNNMLKLTEELHRVDPGNARLVDFYEVATFNHILSTQHPEHGGYVYFTSARPRHYRNYSAPNEAMWCCVGTGMENHGKYGQFIYTVSPDRRNELYVNLFVASELNWKENDIVLRQETVFPYSETSRISIVKGKGTFLMNIRYPGWVDEGALKVSINGCPVQVKEMPGSYVGILRQWKKGDVVEVTFPMHNSIEHLPNVPQYVAIKHGPVLLGMKTGTEDLAHLIADDSRFGQYASGAKLPIDQAPYLIADEVEDIAGDLVPVEGKPLHFTLTTRMENKIEGELQPFFEIHDSRYMIYWLALSKDGYADYIANLARVEQERQALDARTTDKVQPGEQQPESDHFMESFNSVKGVTEDVSFRDARGGGWFSYLMSTGGRSDLSLRLKYWGQDEWRTCEFDIYVDDALIKSVNNTRKWRTSQFKYEEYPIPAELLEGRDKVRIKFVAKPARQVGELYEIRLVTPEK